ncbi:MAG: SMP-30/gluconolactonase/LRE family protein [Verrucomicrobiota bacterium]|nr:SMP-30/gluconolactonase/LRE family protein [Verrucomicrobiota bacterium]
MSTIDINVIGTRQSKWGEGPIWWKRHLLYVDIEGHQIVRLNSETGNEQTWDVGERVGTIVPKISGGLLYAGDSGIVDFNPLTGAKNTLADPEREKRATNRFNDGKCDPAGRFWAGTISLIKNTGDAALYMLDTDNQLKIKLPEVTNSNGICWSPDATIMYYIDTPLKKIQSFKYNIKTGGISEASVAVDTAALGYKGSPDGMTIDSTGMLWVAFCHGGCVVRFNPYTGAKLQQVDLPCLETTACAFGGAELDRLFVTTGVHKTLTEKDAGKVFVLDGIGVQGIPAFAYNG